MKHPTRRSRPAPPLVLEDREPRPKGFASPRQQARREAFGGKVVGDTSVLAPELPQPAPPKALEQAQLAVNRIAIWRKEPWTYVQEQFGAVPDLWQDEILHALVGVKMDGTPMPAEEVKDKLAMKACKGPGKSCLLAWIIWWFLTCFTHPKILVTSITFENLRDGLWSELAYWRNKSAMLKGVFEWQSEKIYAKDHPETWFAAARTWPKDADKTKQASTLAGQHAQHTMIVLDESGGIPVGVLAAGLAHHSTQDPTRKEIHYTLMAGNPETLDSALGWACTEDAKNWHVVEITGDPDALNRSPRIDKKWAHEQIERFGRENPWVLVNVFGKFPPVSANKLLGPDQVRASMAHVTHESTWRESPRIMALDVARSTGRDRSVLCRRQGSVVYPFKTYRLDDAIDLAGQVAFEYSRWKADHIIIDAVGVGGPVADHLRALGLPVIMFHGGVTARDIRFQDRRTETWWLCAQEIKGVGGVPNLALPQDATLVSELCAPILKFSGKGQMKLESKEDMLKRGINSPDLADALTMTFAEPALSIVANAGEISPYVARQLGASQAQAEYDPFADAIRESHERLYLED